MKMDTIRGISARVLALDGLHIVEVMMKVARIAQRMKALAFNASQDVPRTSS